MKKLILSIVVVAIFALALGAAGIVYAQTQTQTPATPVPGSGYSPGMMGGRGQRGGMMDQNAVGIQAGFLHDEMVAAFAQKLGISVDDLNARLASGETMAQIATSLGLTADQFTTLMSDARAQAIDQAVKDGKLTQPQADLMKQRGAGHMAGGGMGYGRGMRGNGQGQFANPDCPYYNQTAP